MGLPPQGAEPLGRPQPSLARGLTGKGHVIEHRREHGLIALGQLADRSVHSGAQLREQDPLDRQRAIVRSHGHGQHVGRLLASPMLLPSMMLWM